MLATFGVGLQGAEVPLISINGLLTFWDESRMEEDSHVMLMLKGHFKGKVDERWHLVPFSNFTWSGLFFRLWMEMALHQRVNLHSRDSGWLFQDQRGVGSKFGQYDTLFRALIDQAQEQHPRLRLEAVNTEDLSLWRPPRQGVVLETANQDVAEKVIKLINRWRKKEAARGSEAGLPTRRSTRRSGTPCHHAKVLQCTCWMVEDTRACCLQGGRVSQGEELLRPRWQKK